MRWMATLTGTGDLIDDGAKPSKRIRCTFYVEGDAIDRNRIVLRFLGYVCSERQRHTWCNSEKEHDVHPHALGTRLRKSHRSFVG